MRITITLLLLVVATSSFGQNWALINPAYKYNYSNDGTDTISNQIRVMQVDTLGPDSFRYELNRIGVVCSTCPLSLGGPCAGCYVRVAQQQFLGIRCVHAGSNWYFTGTENFLIKSAAPIGDPWTFNTSNGTQAMVDAEWATEVFGMPDTVRRILIGESDTLLLSRSYGIIRLDHLSEIHSLLGVEGAGVGRLFPDPLSYFDYQPGDELTYRIIRTWSIGGGNAPPYPGTRSETRVVTITGRTDTDNGVEYSTSISYAGWYSLIGGYIFGPSWDLPRNTWSFDRADILSDHEILGAYPGQVMDTSISDFGWTSASRHLASHGLTEDGRTIMRSQTLGYTGNSPISGFNGAQQVAANTYPYSPEAPMYVWYEEGLGVRYVWQSSTPAGVSVLLIGAIIGGDTIIAPPETNWVTGMNEAEDATVDLLPNPTSDSFMLMGTLGGEQLTIHDMEGRLVRAMRLNTANEAIDVQDLKVGMYVLRVEGMRPQRLLIAR